MSLTVRGDFTNDNAISASGNAGVTANGTLTNNARIESASALFINARDIVNAAGGEIVAADTRVTADNTLTNRGLIDGSRAHVQATTIDNHGRIYGDEIGIAAATLNNMSTGAIAARSSLDIGVTTLNNQPGAELFSAGDLRIGVRSTRTNAPPAAPLR
jgi:filamentous hemagglutinin